jgi:hypothetical protein
MVPVLLKTLAKLREVGRQIHEIAKGWRVKRAAFILSDGNFKGETAERPGEPGKINKLN